jgi:hypothetical protein
MSSESAVLYHGVNDAHEFWQSEDGKIVILRCHHENGWSAHRNFQFQCAGSSAEAAAGELGFPVEFSKEKVFQKDADGKFVLLETTAEITNRFSSLLGRLGTLQGPFVGVPMTPGESPFVIRREALFTIVKGLMSVLFELLPNGWLRISGTTEFGGRHVTKLVNPFVTRETSTYSRGTHRTPVQQEINKWAEGCRKSRRKSARCGATALDKAGRLRQRIEVKIRKVDEQIKRLERKIDQIDVHRPHNPVLMEKPDYDNDWDRRDYQRLYSEKLKRRAISKMAARCAEHYECRQVRKAITVAEQISLFDDEPAHKTVEYHTVTESVWRPFEWKRFYAALAQRGVSVLVPYDKAKNHKNGPSSPSDYCHNMSNFGLMQRGRLIGRDSCSGDVLNERIAEHQTNRKAYVETLREIQSLKMTIASLKEIRVSHEEELGRFSCGPTQPEAQALSAAA